MSAKGHGIRITWTWTWPPVRPKGQKNDKKHAKCLAPSKNLTRGGSPLELSRCLACQAQLTTMEALVGRPGSLSRTRGHRESAPANEHERH